MKSEILRKHLPTYLRKKLPRKIKIIKVGEKESRKLNFRYRKKRKPANVLSFRYGPDASFRSPRAKEDYGEILVCPAVIRREAKAQGNSYKYQLTSVIVHGMLHLAGMHHEKSRLAARKVEYLEEKILQKLFRA